MRKRFDLKQHAVHTKEIFKVLNFVFNEGNYADRAVEKIMRANKKWGVRDRAFVAETVHDMITNWRLLCTVADINERLSERNYSDLLGVWLLFRDYELPDHRIFQRINPDKIKTKLEKYKKLRKVRESVPDWMDELCQKELGTEWDKIIHALNQKPVMFLRTNRLKTTREELQKRLEEENVKTLPVHWVPDAIELQFSRNVFRTEAFREGLFEVQDTASQMVSDLLHVNPGMRVVDACSGTGGKSLHLASLMRNNGRIIALDTKEWKLQELKKRASRAGVNMIETRVIDSSKIIKRLENSADRLLLDVPCSGLGVLRRNPDNKWKLQPDEIERLKKVQQEILEKFSGITKVNGKMVYATCSILPSEGEKQIELFLTLHGEKWKLIAEKRYSPAIQNCDGFYMALLERVK